MKRRLRLMRHTNRDSPKRKLFPPYPHFYYFSPSFFCFFRLLSFFLSFFLSLYIYMILLFLAISSLPTYKLIFFFLISNFRRVLNLVCILLGISPASDCGLPTFRNTLSVPSSRAGCKVWSIFFLFFCLLFVLPHYILCISFFVRFSPMSFFLFFFYANIQPSISVYFPFLSFCFLIFSSPSFSTF